MPLFAPVTTTTFPMDEAADDAIVFAKKNLVTWNLRNIVRNNPLSQNGGHHHHIMIPHRLFASCAVTLILFR
jgi:hypothetical protein